MGMNEADTRAKLIDPALHARGWTEEHIKREETAGAIEIVNGKPRQRAKGYVDYTLRLKIRPDTQPVAVALIEAKAEDRSPGHGLQQAKCYADSKRLNVPFVFAMNGHLYVEYDRFTGQTSAPRPLSDFPAPDELRRRYEQGMGFSLDDQAAQPLLQRYPGGETTRRYYQDAAIRAVLEKIARCERTGQPRRALLSVATGSGKTRIAVYLLKRIADAGQLRRALFICDRDELRSQGAATFQNVFGSNAATVSSRNAQKNARVLIATYQTLGIDSDEADATFLTKNYPRNYFSHIIIDECHRSAWGKWSQVLLMNPDAVQIGLTATPRLLHITENTPAAAADQQLTADNLRYFGEPVYEYDMAQGIEDGYLAACEIVRRDIFLDAAALNERLRGVQRGDLGGKGITDAITGEELSPEEAHEFYAAPSFEDRLQLPDSVQAMTRDLFSHLIATGGPEQKTIIFCTRDSHADAVADALNNLSATWCRETGSARQEPYAFKCTAASGGSDYLADLRGASRSHFVATTVDLLSTGVDVPAVRNIVFFKYVRSPISFYQMVGRGTRLDPATSKLMFRVYDYTDATRLFGEDFISRFTPQSEPSPEPGPERPRERTIRVEGFDVQITDAGRLIVTMVDGRAMPVTVEDYKERLAAQVVQQAPTLDQFRRAWIDPKRRRSLIDHLPDAGRSADLIRQLEDMTAYDLYDVLAELAYGMNPRTRSERANAFAYKHAAWLEMLPDTAAATIEALAGQFAHEGTEGLENPQVFRLPDVAQAGGLEALKGLGKPADVLRETKERMFAA